MLISKTAIVKWNSKIKQHYVDLGYEFTKMGDSFEVSVKDLTCASRSEVTIKCDYCGKLFLKQWQTYARSLKKDIKKDACKNCCEAKAAETINLRYGSYTGLFLSSNDKRKKTNINKYGCENPFGNEKIQEKIKNYYFDNFGVKHNMQLPDCVKKAKETSLKKYGVESYTQTPEWRESHRGENSPVWKGDNVKNPRTERKTPEYRDWRKFVFNRDLYTCQCCGVRNGCGKYVRLEAHHIKNWKDNPEDRFDVNNGITLCIKCHLLFHSSYGKKNTNREQLLEFIEEQNKIDKNIC